MVLAKLLEIVTAAQLNAGYGDSAAVHQALQQSCSGVPNFPANVQRD